MNVEQPNNELGVLVMSKMKATVRGHSFFEVSSAMQKAIRRGDARVGGYWAIELFESGFANYVWKRLLTISAEDCWGILTMEVKALHDGYLKVNEGVPKSEKPRGRIFIAKAVLLLCAAKKSRDADHLTNLVYDGSAIPEDELLVDLTATRNERIEIPAYAFDVHTSRGRRSGKTKADFFRDEHAALEPRVPGLFDELVPGPPD